MKEILENANKTNNKYDIEKIKESEKKCKSLFNFDIDNEYNHILSKSKSSFIEEKDKSISEEKLDLHKSISKSSDNLIEVKNNIEFIDLMCDIIPHEIGKIEIISTTSSKNFNIFRFEYFTTYYTRKELKTFADKKKKFLYKDVKREIGSENNIQKNEENLVVDFSILTEKSEKDFFLYIEDILNEKQCVILENKEVLNEKQIKSTLIRYYALSKKNNIIKIDINKEEMDKDIENNFYLPNIIYNYVEENKINNIVNIHRIKNDFNFLNEESIGFNIKTSNSEKYFKEYLE